MAEETEKVVQEEQQKIKVKVEEKETSLPSLYVNSAQFSRSEWDIRIDFGEQHSVDPETKTMFVIPKIRLLMTPGYAERFLQVFASVVEKWKQAEKQAEAEEKAEIEKAPKEPTG